MKILLTTLDGNIYPVDVSPDLELINLKALCEQETNIPTSEMSLTHNGRPLVDDTKTLENFAIKENDILIVQKLVEANSSVPMIDFSSIAVPPTTSSRPRSSNTTSTSSNNSDLANIRRMFMSNPVQFEMLKQRFPELADALQRNDTAKVTNFLRQLTSGQQSQIQDNFSFSSAELFDPEAQRRIAENIRMQNIQQNMESALEYMPEAFGRVVMLYIDCQVNGHHVKAFVDSGAQMTIMSAACAERCNIMHLVDTRWAGVAKGVGTQKIVGRVHLAQIQIEQSFLTTAFSILEEQSMDMLLGLDILKRHQCIIDLQRNVLVIKSADVETKFLPESDLPYFARLNYEEMGGELPSASKPATSSSNSPSVAVKPASSTDVANTITASPYPDSVISNLTKFGYSKQDVIEALNSSNGDVSAAQIKLLAKSLSVPQKK